MVKRLKGDKFSRCIKFPGLIVCINCKHDCIVVSKWPFKEEVQKHGYFLVVFVPKDQRNLKGILCIFKISILPL